MAEPNHPAVVYVQWWDSYIASEGWTDREESVESAQAMIADPISSAGFLVHEDKVGIVVASSYNQHAEDVQGVVAIPASAIVRKVVLRAARGMES